MATILIFNGFCDGLYQFLQSVSVSDKYLFDIEMIENVQNRLMNDY